MFEIGSTLRQARDRRRLGLDQAEAETKIRARYLRALEDEDFDVLPGPTYVRGFLRTYAHYLGLEGQLFVDEYNSRFSDPSRDDEFIFPRRRSQPPRRRTSTRESNVILVTLAAIVAIGVLVSMAAMYQGSRRPGGSAATIATVATPKPPVNPAATIAQRPAAAKRTAARPAQPVQLVAQAVHGSCWTTIWLGHDQHGRLLYDGQLDPGGGANPAATRRFTSRKGFLVKIAAQGNLQLLVNGQIQVLPTGALFYVAPDGRVTPAVNVG